MASLPRVRQLAAHPTLSEARAGRIPVPHVSDQTLLVWGPVSVEESQSVGASHPASSVVLQLCVPEELRRAVLAEVPADVLPRPDDDAKSLKERLTGSTFLEDSHVLKNGKGPSRVRLNGTCYPQPRRMSWSVVEQPSRVDADGDQVTRLMNYTAYGRPPSDWEAVPMPRPVFDLGSFLFNAAHPFLTERSKALGLPTGCQLLLYYQLFRSYIGRHRDNYNHRQYQDVVRGVQTVQELVQANEGNHHGGDANSQVVGTNVLVYTEGDAAMIHAFSFPDSNDLSWDDEKRKDYQMHPLFSMRLGRGTLLVFSPIDDLFFCHEAFFPDGEEGSHRLAFVFRWLGQARDFYDSNHKHKVTAELKEHAKELSRKKVQKRARDAKAALLRA